MSYGMRDVITLIPPVLLAQWGITSPVVQSIGAVRIENSIDPTYGTVGWLPPLNGVPFAVLTLNETKEHAFETGRIQVDGMLEVFLAIEHAEVPTVSVDYHDRYVAYVDSLRQVIASTFYLQPGSTGLGASTGDVRWRMVSSKHIPSRPILGGAWRGASCLVEVRASILVTYQG